MWSLALNILAYIAFSTAARADRIERMQADVFVPTGLAPMAPSFRLWRSSVTVEELTGDGRALSRRGAHPRLVRELRRRPSASAWQPRRGSRLPAPSLRRTPARLRDRRRVVAARAVAAAAQAHGLDQGGAEAARRRQRGDPLQPRNPADRARPCPPGHRGLRQGPAAGLLEPAVRRNPRPAAGADPHRRLARRDRAPQRPAGRARPRPGR